MTHREETRTQRAVAMLSPQGDRWIVTMDIFAHRCPGGDQHDHCLEKPYACPSGKMGRRGLRADETAMAITALGYEVTT